MKSGIFILIAIVFFMSTSAFAFDDDLTLEKVQAAIAQQGASWTAGETHVSNLDFEHLKQLCGTLLPEPDFDPALLKERTGDSTALPTHYDWRDINGQNFMTSVKDQQECGSCATFSSVGAYEGQIKVTLNNPFIEPDMSEQEVFSCSGCSCYMGGTLFQPLGIITKQGAPDDPCMVYKSGTTGKVVPCDNRCSDYAERSMHASQYKFMMMATVDQIKNALMNGPVVVGMYVFADFKNYTGGVYHHVTGRILGGHGVVIVGWDDADECWIVKNSWSEDWGENGYFRIKWGDSFIGLQAASIIADKKSLCSGDKTPAIQNLTLKNGSEELEESDPLTISFNWSDVDADLLGGELFYSIDEGNPVRYSEPLLNFVGTSSDGKPDDFVFTLKGPFGPGEHTLSVAIRDICANASNILSAPFAVKGALTDDDTDDDSIDDDAGDDASADDDAVSDDDSGNDEPTADESGSGSDNGCGC